MQICFDFDRVSASPAMPCRGEDRRHRGVTAYHSGLCAEDAVARDYEQRGYSVLERRWRGPAGEIDLICKGNEGIVFVEVKKSVTHDMAAARLSARQGRRICSSACAYCADLPDGQLTAMRFDVALVDKLSRVAVIENAIGAW